jgi:hypothetical protein
MHQSTLLCFLVLLMTISVAQDTNFPAGPQYLRTSGSPLFAQSIATPSLSLEAPLPGIPSLPSVGPAVNNQPYTSNPELAHQADLFPIYYGYPRISAVELPSAELFRQLPANIIDFAVTGMTDVQSLHEGAYGLSLGEAASFWKIHKPNVARIITNRDIALTSKEMPLSMIDVGVTGITDEESLYERGYGLSLGEAASFWKAHKPHATRVITNRDIERRHGG